MGKIIETDNAIIVNQTMDRIPSNINSRIVGNGVYIGYAGDKRGYDEKMNKKCSKYYIPKKKAVCASELFTITHGWLHGASVSLV